ncbi:hypothetical protein BDV97DRAFT_372847 [Delphinella strobiligena]|nr:hypothetical protein BDV97DRAFT_372847 [Delphinella strobiligena]
MAKGNYLKGFRVCLIGHFKHNHTDIKKWIQAGGSVVSRAVNEDTTHIVVSLDAWRKKISPELNQLSQRGLKANTFGRPSQRSSRRLMISKSSNVKESQGRGEGSSEGRSRCCNRRQLSQSFVEHISTFGGYKKSEKTWPLEELMSVPSHPYTNENGLCYDIDLTTNRNERLHITSSETDAEPRTYGVSLRSPRSITTEVIGVNMHTAFRSFKKLFRENTGVEWDDRLKTAEQIKSKVPAEVIDVDDDDGLLEITEPTKPKSGCKVPAEVIVIDND